MSVAVVTYLPDSWGVIHLIKLLMSVMHRYVLRLSLHGGEKWKLPGHNCFPPKVGFTTVRLSLSQWLERKSRCRAQILTFSVRIYEAYHSLLEDTNQIISILSLRTIILQNTFHVETFPSISMYDLFTVIDVSSKLCEHAQNCLMQTISPTVFTKSFCLFIAREAVHYG